MGNPKQKWTAEEEEALRAGIAKYGAGKWKFIQRDPDFNHFLHSRSNIDLKDKWRNLSAAAGQGGGREKFKTNTKAAHDASIAPASNVQSASIAPASNVQPAASDVPVPNDSTADQAKDEGDSTRELPDTTDWARHIVLVFEALADKESAGLDLTALLNYIEKRMEVPQNFRKRLGGRLRRLVSQNKLEKVENCFRIKGSSLPELHTPSTKDTQPSQPQGVPEDLTPCEFLEVAARDAAYKIADAESKAYVAAEAVREAERVTRMAEEADSILQSVKEIFDRCIRGEVVLLA